MHLQARRVGGWAGGASGVRWVWGPRLGWTRDRVGEGHAEVLSVTDHYPGRREEEGQPGRVRSWVSTKAIRH